MCGRFTLYEPEWRMVWERLNFGRAQPLKSVICAKVTLALPWHST